MLDHEAEVAVSAAEEAGRVLARHTGPALEEARKSGGEPVSIADLQSDQVIRQRIGRAFPADALLTEEGVDNPSRLGAERIWIIDPLDGTRDFLDGSDEFAVHIGFVIDGNPVLGVVHRPLLDHTYFAVAGKGAFLRRSKGPWERLHVSRMTGSLRVVVTRSHPSRETRLLLELLDPAETLHCGSSGLKCALVAEGSCEAYVAATDRMREWDVCAPQVIVEAAGGRVTNLLGGPLRYNQPDPAVPLGLLASNGEGHDALITKLSGARTEIPWFARDA